MFYKVLEEDDWPLFEKLTSPFIGKQIMDKKRFDDYLMIGAYSEFDISALLVCKKKEAELKIESIYVKTSYREKGIAKELVAFLEDEAKILGIKRISFEFFESVKSIEYMKKILIARGYKFNQQNIHLTFFKSEDVQRSRFAKKVFKNFNGYELFNLSEFKDEDKIAYQEIVSKKSFPIPLAIDNHDFPIETACSYGIRKNNRVCGWCLCHRIDPTSVRLSALYIDQGHHSLIAFTLLNASLRSFAKIEEKPELIVCTCAVFDKMDKIVRGTLSESAYQTLQSNVACKEI